MLPVLSSTGNAARCIVGLLYVLSATASAIPADAGNSIEERAPEGHSCAGSTDKGVYGCVSVVFKDRYDLDIDLSVKDTKGDSHSVYVWIRVYDDRGNTNLSRVPNHSGAGKTISQHQTWKNTRGRVTGFRAEACVDVQLGADKCFEGNFVKNPLP